MNRPLTRFVCGLSIGLGISLGLNLFPYWLSYGAYATDGCEVIGFPLIFSRFGGFSPVYEFRVGVLLIDIAIGGAIALATGLAAMKLLPFVIGRSGHGFPVLPKSGGGSAAE